MQLKTFEENTIDISQINEVEEFPFIYSTHNPPTYDNLYIKRLISPIEILSFFFCLIDSVIYTEGI